MRRFLLMALAIASLALTSCTRTYYEQEIYELHPKVVKIDVPKNKWAYSDPKDQTINNFYYADVTVPEITKQAYNNGLVKMYRVFNDGNSTAQIEMPYIRHYEYENGMDGQGNTLWSFYTETVDYEFTVGSLRIIYTASDFEYEVDPTIIPEAMSFRLVVYE